MKRFGDFQFDKRSMRLLRGGSRVSINGQCVELLGLMLERPGEVVTREEIRRALWPDSNVDFEHSLDVLINRLRMALGDDPRSARYIQTVPKKGYRFVGELRLEPSGAETSPVKRWARSIARYASVAVLAALVALLIAHTRYQEFVPQGRPAQTSHR